MSATEVLDTERRQGIASILIKESRKLLQIESIEAETDKSAVDFYRKCGFDVFSLGEKYPGVERFRCTLD